MLPFPAQWYWHVAARKGPGRGDGDTVVIPRLGTESFHDILGKSYRKSVGGLVRAK